MTTQIAILGAGPGGYVAAVKAAQLGADVTVIEKEYVGGTCLNWGCIPSKVLIATAGLLEKFKQAEEFGISVGAKIQPDLLRLQERKQAVVQSQRQGILGLFKRYDVKLLQGTGLIRGLHLLAVEQHNGSKIEVSWDKLILATGSKPFEIAAFPFDGNRILSSNHVLELKKIPESMLIVGGGIIGCEFAFILNALGVDVTVVEMLPRLLPFPAIDEVCSKVLLREMKKKKIKVILNSKVEAVEKTEHNVRVDMQPLNGTAQRLTVTADKMLICTGRIPNTDNLGLETVGIQLDEYGWIKTDARLETTEKDIYAIGDVLGPARSMLAHTASAEGKIAAENAMGGSFSMDYQAIPSAVFTQPEVACVGLSEVEAKGQGLDVQSHGFLFRSLGKAHVIGEIAGEVKIVADEASSKILGVHIIGPHATELIAEATLAIKMGAVIKDLAETIHAHPTLAEIMMEAADCGKKGK